MIIMQGKGISAGIAIGSFYYYQRITAEIKTYKIIDTDAEWNRFKTAQTKVIEQLSELAADVKTKVGEQEAFLFETYRMLVKDFDYEGIIEQNIKEEKLNAETAVKRALEVFTEMFAAMQDTYMRERLKDIRDVSERIIGILNGVMPEYIDSEVPVILVAEDFTPSEMIQLDKTKVVGIVTAEGSGLSHTAILARAMEIPMIVGIGAEWKEGCHGKRAVMDGGTGSIVIEPAEDMLQVMLKKQEQLLKQRSLLEQLKGKENITLDGQKIRISCNISSPEEVLSVHQNDADGIGLFRSEFLYLNRSTYPTEEEQYEAYKKVLSEMKGKEVIVRTCDMGADKQISYFDLPKEENSAMGFRSLRISLMRPEFFRIQLRALYRASVYGRLGILFPMVTSVWEVREIKNICKSVEKELEREGIFYSKKIELGIMIETPAAAIISDELAKEVDFFSCGTNDLTQFILACDRQNPNLECFYDPHHPAVLRLLKMVCENAHANGIWVGICGELGADLELIETFLEMGVDELSVSPNAVLPLRQAVCSIDTRKGMRNML